MFSSLVDEDTSIKKTGLSLIHTCIVKANEKDFKKAFNIAIEQNKF